MMIRRVKDILIFLSGLACFLGYQVSRAGNFQDNQPVAMATRDTIKTDSSVFKPLPLPDPKGGFKSLLDLAYRGDGMTGAKLNPMAITFVENYISKNRKSMLVLKEKNKLHLDLMEKILAQHGIPGEMKYLSVIESGLKQNALSKAGALGPWGFMPLTAQHYGLRVGSRHDDRTDYFKSTHAAASLLTDLFAKYGDWLLVIAAYNGGDGNVDKAIRKAGGSRDFWTIQHYLPNESMNHVKKFIGTHYIFEGEGGMTTITKTETQSLLSNALQLSDEEKKQSTEYDITGRFSSSVIVKHIELDMETFNRYNPGFDHEIALNSKYHLRLPTQKMNIFVSKRYQILEESIQLLLSR
jgi:membrane-bound lytic murein transglycosylase D